VVLGGSVDFRPYTDNPLIPAPSAGVPVAHHQLIDDYDYWMHGLDPFALATIAAQLRAQADHLDHQVGWQRLTQGIALLTFLTPSAVALACARRLRDRRPDWYRYVTGYGRRRCASRTQRLGRGGAM
jgi:hypothetical protein